MAIRESRAVPPMNRYFSTVTALGLLLVVGCRPTDRSTRARSEAASAVADHHWGAVPHDSAQLARFLALRGQAPEKLLAERDGYFGILATDRNGGGRQLWMLRIDADSVAILAEPITIDPMFGPTQASWLKLGSARTVAFSYSYDIAMVSSRRESMGSRTGSSVCSTRILGTHASQLAWRMSIRMGRRSWCRTWMISLTP